MANKIMIHYGELYTKGKNRSKFIMTLSRNIREKLKPYHVLVNSVHDHIYISQYKEEEIDDIFKILKTVSGIHAISLISLIDRDIDSLISASLKLISSVNGNTFKVVTKRVDKFYPMMSDAINREIAKHILLNTDWKVDVVNPDFKIIIQIHTNGAYFITRSEHGLGGYPLGTIGKSLIMLSGGIDSPVAAYHMLRRGVRIEAIHFASPPYTSEAVISKLKRMLAKLNIYQDNIVLYVIPFTKLQEEIYKNVPNPYAITIMRRMMYRIATGMAKYKRINVLVTGESLGQVASQTMESINVINEVTSMPIIRPLATIDKLSIIDQARIIDTYNISTEPFEDCCTIFPNKNPVTKPKLREARAYEELFDYQTLINECLHNYQRIEINVNNPIAEEELL